MKMKMIHHLIFDDDDPNEEDNESEINQKLPEEGLRPGPWSREYANHLSGSIKKLGSFTNPCIERTLSIPLLFMVAVLWVLGTTLNNSGYTELVDPFSSESSFSTYAHDIKARSFSEKDNQKSEKSHSSNIVNDISKPYHLQFEQYSRQNQISESEEQKALVHEQRQQHKFQLDELKRLGEQLKTELQQFKSSHLLESKAFYSDKKDKDLKTKSFDSTSSSDLMYQNTEQNLKQNQEIDFLKEQVEELRTNLYNVSALAAALKHHIQTLSTSQKKISQEREMLNENLLDQSKNWNKDSAPKVSSSQSEKQSYLTLNEVTEVVDKMINLSQEKFFADRIGMPDFALESTGAKIISSMTSATYETYKNISKEKENIHSSFDSIINFLKIIYLGQKLHHKNHMSKKYIH